jgi:tetratricopeptide (TPR) repeat protein
LTVEFNATRKLPGAKVRILEAEKVIAEQPADLNAATLFSKTFAVPSGSRCTIEVRDGKGELLLGHTEDRYDADSPEPAQLGPQKRPALERKTAEDLFASGERNELNGFPRFALNDYREGLKRAPNSPALLKALGRLDVEQKRFEEANKVLTAAAQASPTDPEVHYYLGVAKAALQDDAAAAREFESAAADHNLHAAATVQLAAARSRTHDAAGALKLVQSIASEQPEIIRAGEIEIALLRHSGNRDEAKAQLQRWRALDPTDSVLRYEAMKLGGGDDLLWQHLAADPDRVLNVAVAYMALGFYDDALDVLSHEYVQPADALASEPGAVLPQRDPLVVYYRGYCRALTGASGREDFEQASKLPLRYIFPNRASSFAVLNAALKANPQDATALDLLGSLYVASDDVDHAIAAWEDARSAHSTDPEMYRNLGRAQLELKKDRWGAIDAYNDGLSIAPDDPVMKKGLEAALRPAPSPATAAPVKSELAQAAPAPGSNPLEFAAYALTLLTSGDIAGAQGVFNARNFPAEKQDPVVRETYIEVQVQGVLQMARAGKCAEANDAEQQIGDLHDELPFTFHGFASILKGPRMQYYLGEVAYICGNEKEARKLWGKAAKSSRPASDIDFVFPYLAASRIEPDGKSQLKTALEQIRAAERSGTPSAAMQYSEAVLLRALGDSDSANKLLATAAKAQDPMLASYLARMALRQRVE